MIAHGINANHFIKNNEFKSKNRKANLLRTFLEKFGIVRSAMCVRASLGMLYPRLQLDFQLDLIVETLKLSVESCR